VDVRGVGDFLAHGDGQFLIQNTAGAVVVGDVVNGQASYTQVRRPWAGVEVCRNRRFSGRRQVGLLIENAAGRLWRARLRAAGRLYAAGRSSPEWKFVGAGDFLGEGHDQFLIENTVGAVVVCDWTAGQIHFTQVSGLGSEWLFHM